LLKGKSQRLSPKKSREEIAVTVKRLAYEYVDKEAKRHAAELESSSL
jgi:hypothetical protein